MKRNTVVLSFVTLLFLAQSVRAIPPTAPVLMASANGLEVTLAWSQVSNATSYKLYYAPHPYAGAHTITSADMGAALTLSATLWEGGYYIAITASNGEGVSSYSNIELIETTAASCDNTDYSMCTTESACTGAGGVWWNAPDSSTNTCGPSVTTLISVQSGGSVHRWTAALCLTLDQEIFHRILRSH